MCLWVKFNLRIQQDQKETHLRGLSFLIWVFTDVSACCSLGCCSGETWHMVLKETKDTIGEIPMDKQARRGEESTGNTCLGSGGGARCRWALQTLGRPSYRGG